MKVFIGYKRLSKRIIIGYPFNFAYYLPWLPEMITQLNRDLTQLQFTWEAHDSEIFDSELLTDMKKRLEVSQSRSAKYQSFLEGAKGTQDKYSVTELQNDEDKLAKDADDIRCRLFLIDLTLKGSERNKALEELLVDAETLEEESRSTLTAAAVRAGHYLAKIYAWAFEDYETALSIGKGIFDRFIESLDAVDEDNYRLICMDMQLLRDDLYEWMAATKEE